MLHRFPDFGGQSDVKLMLKPLSLSAEFGLELLDHGGRTAVGEKNPSARSTGRALDDSN
jgi:hypothetical protein